MFAIAAPGVSNVPRGNFPVFFMGDFNSPSHLDHTSATCAAKSYVESRGKDIPCQPFAWPATAAMANAGFIDSFRQVQRCCCVRQIVTSTLSTNSA